LDELRWGYQAFPVHDDPASGGLGWDVIVEATREPQVAALLSLCAEAGWRIDGVQGECLARHNFLAHEYLAEDRKRPSAAAIAMLDVGASSSKLLVSSPRTAWFRSFPGGGHAVTGQLTQTYKLTHAQAEQLKRTPTAARRVSQLYETIDPFLLRLADDVQRSLEMHARAFPNLRIQQMFGVGGGFALHGLLQRLRQGR
jgi:Tfp pilus assembly PilM family ATPase